MSSPPVAQDNPPLPVAPVKERTRVTFADAALMGALSSAVGLLLTLVRSKVTAVALGPSGLGVTGKVTQYALLMSTVAGTVTGAALTSELAEAHARQDAASSRRIYSTAVTAVLLLSLVGTLLSTLVSGLLLGPELGPSVWLYSLLAAVGIFGGIVASLPTLVLTAHGELKLPVRINLYVGVLPAIATVGCILLWGLPGQFLSLALGPLIAAAVALPLASRALPHFPWRTTWMLDWRFLRTVARLGAASLVAAATLQAVQVLIRDRLDRQGGSALVGQFQAAWSIGATYFSLVLGGLSSFAFPRYAAATTQEELAREISDAGRFVLRNAPPIVFGAIALADLVIQLLYSGRFLPASQLLAWQFVGDLPKALSWVFGGALLFRRRARATVLAEVFYAAVLAAGVLVLVPRWGLEGVGFAYVLAYVGFLFLVLWLLRRECGIPIPSRQLGSMLGLTVLAAALVVAVRHWPAARLLALLVAGTWWWRVGALGQAARRAGRLLRRVRSGGAELPASGPQGH